MMQRGDMVSVRFGGEWVEAIFLGENVLQGREVLVVQCRGAVWGALPEDVRQTVIDVVGEVIDVVPESRRLPGR